VAEVGDAVAIDEIAVGLVLDEAEIAVERGVMPVVAIEVDSIDADMAVTIVGASETVTRETVGEGASVVVRVVADGVFDAEAVLELSGDDVDVEPTTTVAVVVTTTPPPGTENGAPFPG